MSRRTGVTPEQTRADLLRAAMTVFSRDGFEGASIADITAEAGTSSGPIYLHFGGKAGLFAAMLEAHTDRELDAVLGDQDRGDATALLAILGSDLSRRQSQGDSLLVEAVVAARRDPELARLVAETFTRRQQQLSERFEQAQASGTVDARHPPETVARFAMVVALGSLLIGSLDLPPTDTDAWSDLVGSILQNLEAR